MDNFKNTVKNKMQCAVRFSNRFAGPIRAFKKFFVGFCDSSNIHGVRYFTERTLHWTERLWWLMAIAVSLWMCGSLTRNIWDDWNETPVALSFTEMQEPVAIIPFPEVTLCLENMIDKNDFDFIDTPKSMSNLSDTQKEQLSALAHICPLLQMKQFDFEDDFASESIYEQIKTLSPNQSNIACQTCHPVLTDVGICYRENALNSSAFYTDEMAPGMQIMNIVSRKTVANWHFEPPFNYTLDDDRYPIQSNLYGRDKGTFFHIWVPIRDVKHKCHGFEPAFRVAFNMPGEPVKLSKNFIRIPNSETTRIILKPKLTYTSEELRSYDPNQRQCYFYSERQLRFFKIYSQSGCEQECLANFTKIQCGCVKLTMPRDNKTRICGGAKVECYKSAEQKLYSDSEIPFREQCNCMPSCTTVEYHYEIERSKYDRHQQVYEQGLDMGLTRIFYADGYMTTVKRVPVYTYLDFVAHCGGFLGVCLGASALSIIELIYFASLRLYWSNQTPKPSKIFTAIERYLSELRLVRGIRWFFNELCDNSNIHGFFYFTRLKLHWSERLFWLISVGGSIWMSYSLIHGFLLQWNANMVTLHFSQSPASISTIPLPTITICSDVKSMLNKLNGTNLQIAAFKNEYYRDKVEFRAAYHTMFILQGDRRKTTQEMMIYTNESEAIYDAIREVSPQLNDTLVNCWWRNEPINCSEYFVSIVTEEGHCFAFNALNSDEIYTDEMASGMKIVVNSPRVNNWTAENGYTNEPNPMRLSDSGKETTFKISFEMVFADIEVLYRMYGSDFKVMFTTPGDTSRFSIQPHQVSLLRDVRLNIQPKKTTTSALLRSYTPNQRQCYFESERQLEFFKIYTQTNCELECLANHQIEKFGCVKFHLPRRENTTICGLRRKKEVIAAETEFWNDERVVQAMGKKEVRSKCNCLATCTTIEYNVVADKSYLHSNRINTKKDDEVIKKAELTISIGNSVEIVERKETYTFAEFLAICGGLLGLFMGISALSIIELVYFCTLRWFWKLRRGGNEHAIESHQPQITNVVPCEE